VDLGENIVVHFSNNQNKLKGIKGPKANPKCHCARLLGLEQLKSRTCISQSHDMLKNASTRLWKLAGNNIPDCAARLAGWLKLRQSYAWNVKIYAFGLDLDGLAVSYNVQH
jgi:hypothetical protein